MESSKLKFGTPLVFDDGEDCHFGFCISRGINETEYTLGLFPCDLYGHKGFFESYRHYPAGLSGLCEKLGAVMPHNFYGMYSDSYWNMCPNIKLDMDENAFFLMLNIKKATEAVHKISKSNPYAAHNGRSTAGVAISDATESDWDYPLKTMSETGKVLMEKVNGKGF